MVQDDFSYFYKSDTYNRLDTDMYVWCEKHFGPFRPERAPSNTFRWATTFSGYYFKEEKDYLYFMLRWS